MNDNEKEGNEPIAEKQFDKVIGVTIEDQMKDSYIDYAMSVIVSRALPDVRDGLKPVHRRILYAMKELNLEPNKPYRKSARIVGDTMGKYHPHGNTSIYDAMVRMAQDFSMRYLLVDGHGNFGSMDGDGAAAERYTEARMTRLSVEMLADIEKNTVDFQPNFDETEKEPRVLPCRFPNLLVNGSAGIAVGMATNIPPHNLTEVINGVIKIIDNHILEDRETDIEELIEIIKGPDFPTSGVMLGTAGVKAAYRTGRGKVRVRAVASIEPMSGAGDREQIIVTEIPYQVNKSRMIEKIDELVQDKRIDGISSVRDESNRNGIRVVIELKRDVNANVILNQLYKHTQLQESFGINMLALVNDEPQTLNLKDMLVHYISHQKDVVTRRTIFELEKVRKRAHILEGLRVALDFIDEVLNLIRSSRSTAIAKERLIERFEFSEEQAQAIVDLRFRALTGMEREKLDAEYAELRQLMEELSLILANERRLYEVIREELLIIKTKYGDERRTQIVRDEGEIDIEDLIDDEMVAITLTHMNYVKRTSLSTYKSQNRGGRGIVGMQTRDNDLVRDIFVASTHDYVMFFTTKGKVYRLKGYEIPDAGRNAKGTPIVNLLELDPGEKISAVIPMRESAEGSFLLMITAKGIIKKTIAKAFSNIRKAGMIALNIHEDDELITVQLTDGSKQIFIATKNGMAILIDENDVRGMGRTAAGVKAIRLKAGDKVVAGQVIEPDSKIVFVTSRGYGKCTMYDNFNMQRRGGMGLKCYKITPKTGELVGVNIVNDSEELMMITNEGVIIRLRVKEISTLSRVTQGVKLMNVADGVEVVSVAKVAEDEEEEQDEQNEQEDRQETEDAQDDIME